MSVHLNQPLLCLWFGNFYRPAFDDRDFVDESMRKISRMGFNCIELDSKAWEDFQIRCRGGEASDYVAQQEYMMEAARREGLAYIFLALYGNGDNLYPHIRFSPPIHGESVTRRDGTDGKWYKYWAEAAKDSQREHIQELLATYPDGQAEMQIDGKSRLPICSMWDPMVMPSFDGEGQQRYRRWLERRYGTIDALNAAYGTQHPDFRTLQPEDWWFEAAYPGRKCYTREEMNANAPIFRMWTDNTLWRSEELELYFADMQHRLHAIDPRLYLMPNFSQWNHFLNVELPRKADPGTGNYWDTANKGLDLRRTAPWVDMAHYYTLPVNADSDPEPYTVSCQHAHIRSLNPGRSFLGGIFWGRFLYHDVYRFVTPEETIGSITASGASGIMSYGWCGMDDGGLLHRMDEGFTDSLTRGNAWAKKVIPRLGKRKRSRVAIMYPTAMALLEPLTVADADEKRADFLGIYKACRDFGYDPEIVEAPDLIQELEADVLLIPADECYHAVRSDPVEEALRRFVKQGGIIIHGPDADPVRLAFGLKAEATAGQCFTYRAEGGLPSGRDFVSWEGEPIAFWREEKKACISRTAWGRGAIYSLGFSAGFQYISRTAPHVPFTQRNNELYPISMMQKDPLRDLLAQSAERDAPMAMKDIECTEFEYGWVVISHRAAPVRIPIHGSWHGTQPGTEGVLPGHSAVWIEKME